MGDSPGVKFFVGATLWADFPSQDLVVGPDTSQPMPPDSFFTAPSRGYVVTRGPQVFFGPTLGVQFGH